MNLEDHILFDMQDFDFHFDTRKDKNIPADKLLIKLGEEYCKRYNAQMWGLYFDKGNQVYRVQFEIPKA